MTISSDASALSLMNAHLRGVPLAIIGSADVYDAKNPYAQMVTTSDAPFATAKDLIGKTVGVPSLNDLNVLAADVWLDKNGGASHAVKPLGPAYTAIADAFLITAWFVSTDWAAKHPDRHAWDGAADGRGPGRGGGAAATARSTGSHDASHRRRDG